MKNIIKQDITKYLHLALLCIIPLITSLATTHNATKTSTHKGETVHKTYAPHIPNGTIISSEPFLPHAYESLTISDQANSSPAQYAHYIAWYQQVTDVEFLKIIYKSDGLYIVGILAQPKQRSDKKYPVIIYNRGGSNDDGRIMVTTLKNRLYSLVQAGYVVLASQYRGNDGGQGKDECGGLDVHDVLALRETIKTLDYVDQNNIFMIGYSRGAINSYCAVKKGFAVNALAVIAGVSDLIQFQQARPEAQPLIESMIPTTQYYTEYQQRSCIYWPEKISAPLLLIHGDNDTIVSVSQSEALAQQCIALQKPYQLIICPGGDHFLAQFKNEINAHIIDWFKRYTK